MTDNMHFRDVKPQLKDFLKLVFPKQEITDEIVDDCVQGFGLGKTLKQRKIKQLEYNRKYQQSSRGREKKRLANLKYYYRKRKKKLQAKETKGIE